MKTISDYSLLSNRIARGSDDLVKDILQKNSGLDLTYDEGRFLILAIEHNHVDITKSLLKYFEQAQLNKCQLEQQREFLYPMK